MLLQELHSKLEISDSDTTICGTNFPAGETAFSSNCAYY
jgi:hypothetical protein